MENCIEIKTMACAQKVTFTRGYSSFSCTGYDDNRYNCSTCIVLHRLSHETNSSREGIQ
jgi:hypothetical protein